MLTRRELGRATLARQLLLERAPLGVVAAVERLAGMQAQEPRPPFIGLWSRLRRLRARRAARRAALRARSCAARCCAATLHLVSAADWSAFRGAVQPALSRAARGARASASETLDLDAARAPSRAGCCDGRRERAGELRAPARTTRFPDEDAARARLRRAHARCRSSMVPTEDRWGFPRDPRLAARRAGRTPATARPELVRRYLAAYGPGDASPTPRSGRACAGLAPTFEALRGELVALRATSAAASCSTCRTRRVRRRTRRRRSASCRSSTASCSPTPTAAG